MMILIKKTEKKSVQFCSLSSFCLRVIECDLSGEPSSMGDGAPEEE